jgi:septum site-determining protein MinC
MEALTAMADRLASLTAAGSAPRGGAAPPPNVRLRGRNFMALVIAPQPPLGAWFAALDAQMQETGDLFGDRPVVADLSEALLDGPQTAFIVLDGLEARNLRLVGIEGVERALLAGTRWARLASGLHGREVTLEPRAAAGAEGAAPAEAPPSPSLLIDRPVRSGQSIVFEEGDVTIVGAVASGAEVIAGGSVHVYGPLRGRAIAGVRIGDRARIFCRRLEAELVGVDRLYRTSEHWGADLHGRAVQVVCDRGALRLSALD